MLKMRIVEDKQEIVRFAENYGVPTDRDLHLYVAENRGALLGVCFYRFTEDGMEILSVDAQGDTALYDGLIRAAMSALFDCENDRVDFAETMDRDMLEACGFVTKDELCIKSANVFFETCKKCKN